MDRVNPDQIKTSLAALQGWTYVPAINGGPDWIMRTVKTGNFLAGLALTTRAAVLAEKHNHHPDILLTYPTVTFTLTTHDAGGVTEQDLQLAKEIDGLR